MRKLIKTLQDHDQKNNTQVLQDTLNEPSALNVGGFVGVSSNFSVEKVVKDPIPVTLPEEATDKLRKMSYNYQGMISNYISGKFRFNGRKAVGDDPLNGLVILYLIRFVHGKKWQLVRLYY